MNVCQPRVDKRLNWNAKEFVKAEERAATERPYTKPNNPRKYQCKGARCSNQPKKGCEFEMCGRCCKKIAEPCSVHDDAFSVFEPPVFERNLSFYMIEPKVFFRFVSKGVGCSFESSNHMLNNSDKNLNQSRLSLLVTWCICFHVVLSLVPIFFFVLIGHRDCYLALGFTT